MIRNIDTQQLRQDVEELVGSNLDREAFYQQLLATLSQAMGALGGVAWNTAQLPFEEICHFHAEDGRAIRLSCTAQEHIGLLQKTYQESHSQLAFPSVPDDGSRADDPPPVIIMGPVLTGEYPSSMLEIFLPSGAETDDYQQAARLIVGVCDLISGYELNWLSQRPRSSQADGVWRPGFAQNDAVVSPVISSSATGLANTGFPGSGSVSLEQSPRATQGANTSAATSAVAPANAELMETFCDQIHRSLDWTETAAEIANESRRVLGCDRVSVIGFQRNRAKIVAVSGQPSVNRRSNTVRGLEAVSTNVLRAGEELWYPSVDPLPPQINHALEDYFLESVAKNIAIIPLKDRRPKPDPDEERKEKPPRIFAGLVVEYLNESVPHEAVSAPIDQVARHSENALRNAHQHRSLFLYGLWNLLGKSRVITKLRNLPITLAVVFGIILLVAALTFIPADFNISSDGNLVPKNREDVFARVDGTVTTIKVGHKSEVKAGETLLQLESNDLDLKRQQTLGELEQAADRLKTINAALHGSQSAAANSAQRRQDLLLEQKQLEASRVSLQKQLEIIKEEAAKLNVVAERDGTVLTWNVADQLQDRPVRQGELLMELADLNGGWQLELNLPDRRIGHVLEAQRQLEEGLKVTFILASDPSRRFEGHVTEVSRKTEVNMEKGQTIRVAVDIDAEDMPFLHSSTGVTAKIHCGKRKLGYVWLHDVFEFVQSKVIFPFF
jgi:hypothetical protein